MTQPHVFSGNPLDRGERERRDEEWISNKAKEATSRFLPMWDSKVLISEASQPQLGWLGLDDLTRAGADLDPWFLGFQGDTAYFVVDVSSDEAVGERLQGIDNFRFEDARATAEMVSGPEAGILAQGRAQINWHNRHGSCSVCGHQTVIRRGGQKRECP